MSEGREDGQEGPLSTFQSLFAEGDGLCKQGDHRKAVDAFTKALILKPGDKNALIARSKCYLLLGSPNSALVDAEEALKDDPLFYKAIFQKAEAFYAKGEFESALLFFYRGHAARPEVDDFRLGIQKAKEAINNAIGDPRVNKIVAKGVHVKADAGNKYKRMDVKSSAEMSREKHLLGELYDDKIFLEDLYIDDEGIGEQSKAQIQSTLKYIDSRIEFWRQQKPHKTIGSASMKPVDQHPKHLQLKLITACFRNIEGSFEKNDLQGALHFAEHLLGKLTPSGDKVVADKELPLDRAHFYTCLASCYEWLGKIYVRLERYSTAVKYMKKGMMVVMVRALENLYNALVGYKRNNELIPLLSSLLKNLDKDAVSEHERVLKYIAALSSCYSNSGDDVNAVRIYNTHTPFIKSMQGEQSEVIKAEFAALKAKFARKLSMSAMDKEVEGLSISKKVSEPQLPESVA